jgi:hypothetical protein
MDELTNTQTLTVALLYGSAFGGLILLAILRLTGRLPHWVMLYYLCACFLCGAGWELWWTYGWPDGQSILLRRPEAMNEAVPLLANGVCNALGDAFGIAVVGLGLARVICGKAAFDRWNWGVFTVLFVWFVGENIVVELTVYHGQIAVEALIAWAPLSPFGSWWNPILFEIAGRSVHLQTQMPWVLMTPILYALAIYLKRRCASGAVASP